MENRRDLPGSENLPRKRRYNLLKFFFTFWKTVKMYGGENERVDENVSYMRETLDFFFATQDQITILFDGIDMKIDKERIRGRRQEDKFFDDLYDLFLSLCLSQVTFHRGVTDPELLAFFRTIGPFPVGREPKKPTYDRFLSLLPQNMAGIRTVPYDPEESGGLPVLGRFEMARENYKVLVTGYDEMRKSVAGGEAVPFKHLERRVQIFIDLMTEKERKDVYEYVLLLASLDSFKKNNDYATHIVNTAIYSLAIGTALSLSGEALKKLGVSALLHGIMRPEDDSVDENALSNFSKEAFLAISRLEDFSMSRVDAAVCAAFRAWDFSDNEQTRIKTGKRGTIAEEIVRVAKFFEMMSRKRASRLCGRKGPLTMFHALRTILHLRREHLFLPIAAEALVQAVGIYPPGQLCGVYNTDYYGFSLARFPNFSSEGDVCIMDRSGVFVKKMRMRADVLIDMPDIAMLRPPGSFLEKIFSLYRD
jgi:hypothetical protein